MEEYKQWLEQQIERCLNEKDLQREHWAFCKAYEKFTALRQPLVIGSVCDGCGSRFDAMDISVGVCYCCQKEIKQTDIQRSSLAVCKIYGL